MDLSLSEDQQTLRTAFAEFFDKEATVERVRAAEPLGFDQDLWAKLTGTGAVAMGLPEEAGGGGATNLDLALVAEQYGRRLAPVPFVEAAVARAQQLAGDRMVEVAAGDVGGQVLAAGLIDEVRMDVVPVVFGSGKRYFGPVRAQHLLEDPDVVIQGNRVLHLRYRVRR